MINRISALLVAVALTVSGVVHAQAAKGGRATDEEMNSISASMRTQIRVIADSAFAAGLPVEPILDLARRGKNRPADSVVPVASRLLSDLRTSHAALGAGATMEDIKVGADAIKAGVKAATLTRIATEKRNAELYVSLSVLSDLVTSEVPIDTAVRMVSRLLAAGIGNADLTSYRDNVREDITIRGAIPSAAATSRGEATILRAGTTDFTTNGPGARPTTVRVKIPPEEN